jgi:toxin ParE1/3/4
VSRSYVVSKGAAADIREITKYTVEQWGQAQCRAYIAELENATEALAKGEGFFKNMEDVLPGLRMSHCGKHYIFCMPQKDSPALILAILHERMDIIARLRNRL